jgi:hypothetical protein
MPRPAEHCRPRSHHQWWAHTPFVCVSMDGLPLNYLDGGSRCRLIWNAYILDQLSIFTATVLNQTSPQSTSFKMMTLVLSFYVFIYIEARNHAFSIHLFPSNRRSIGHCVFLVLQCQGAYSCHPLTISFFSFNCSDLFLHSDDRPCLSCCFRIMIPPP